MSAVPSAFPERRVRQLDPHTVNQIAAGEVVERPASVVKELVENAIDAGATRIDVELVDAGRTRVLVRDDGCGMSAEDASLALQRHATSKIREADDLLSIASLGFRGEALPSIASVSRFHLTTGTGNGIRTQLEVEGGATGSAQATSGPRGTEIIVEDLFFNVPARRKFLKSDTSELGQILDHLSRYAFAYPEIAFRVTHNEQTAIETPGRGDDIEAVAAVWGREVARALIPIQTHTGDLMLSGFISPPHMTRPTRAYQFIYVNKRPVRSRNLTVAVDVALRDITPERRYPYLVLFLDIDPARVDINVSPTKSEVRFQQEGFVFDAIRLAIKNALLEHGMMPTLEQIARVNDALKGDAGSPTPSMWTGAAFPPSAPAPTSHNGATFRPGAAPEDFGGEPAFPATSVSEFPSLADTPAEIERPASENLSELPFASLLDGLRVIGQALNTFIIAETRGGIVMIDQHVAHERIIYEHLCGIRGRVPIEKQILLVPQTLDLDRRAAALLGERIEEIRDLGFDLDAFGAESFVVRAVPAAIRGKDPIRMLRDMVDELVESTVSRRLMPTREQIWIMCSCKMAVKAGDPLSHAEMEKLIVDLALTENPYLCPHGRPITVTLSGDALYRLFKRT